MKALSVLVSVVALSVCGAAHSLERRSLLQGGFVRQGRDGDHHSHGHHHSHGEDTAADARAVFNGGGYLPPAEDEDYDALPGYSSPSDQPDYAADQAAYEEDEEQPAEYDEPAGASGPAQGFTPPFSQPRNAQQSHARRPATAPQRSTNGYGAPVQEARAASQRNANNGASRRGAVNGHGLQGQDASLRSANGYGAPGEETDAAQRSANGYGAPEQGVDAAQRSANGYGAPVQEGPQRNFNGRKGSAQQAAQQSVNGYGAPGQEADASASERTANGYGAPRQNAGQEAPNGHETLALGNVATQRRNANGHGARGQEAEAAQGSANGYGAPGQESGAGQRSANGYGAPGQDSDATQRSANGYDAPGQEEQAAQRSTNGYGAPGQGPDAAQRSVNGYGAPAQDPVAQRNANADAQQQYSGSGSSTDDETDALPQYDRANLASYGSGDGEQSGYEPADDTFDYGSGEELDDADCEDCTTDSSLGAYNTDEDRLGGYGSGDDSLGSYEDNSLESAASNTSPQYNGFPFAAVEQSNIRHCPGGSLESCVAICPGKIARVYAACVQGCGNRCTL